MNKSNFNFKKVLFVIFLIFCVYIISMTYIIQHETIHYKIFERYGIESKISLSWFVSGQVDPNPNDYYKCNDYCKLAHGLNDIISYSTALLIMALFFIYVLYLIRSLLREKEWKKDV